VGVGEFSLIVRVGAGRIGLCSYFVDVLQARGRPISSPVSPLCEEVSIVARLQT